MSEDKQAEVSPPKPTPIEFDKENPDALWKVLEEIREPDPKDENRFLQRVYKVLNKQNGQIAFCKATSHQSSYANPKREFQTNSSVRHKYIVEAYDFVESEGWDYLFTEYLDPKHWDRLDRIGKLSLQDSIGVVRMTAEAADALAKVNIDHGDISTWNIFLSKDKSTIKLTDFDGAVFVDKDATKELAQSRPRSTYTATQIIELFGDIVNNNESEKIYEKVRTKLNKENWGNNRNLQFAFIADLLEKELAISQNRQNILK